VKGGQVVIGAPIVGVGVKNDWRILRWRLEWVFSERREWFHSS